MEGINIVKHKFTEQEDEELKSLAESLSFNWRQVSKSMTGRSSRQCRERYKYFLSPSITQESWTEEEDKILRERFHDIGPKWATIAQHLNGRTQVSAKNRFKKLTRNNKIKPVNRSHKYSKSTDDSARAKPVNKAMLVLPVPISKLSPIICRYVIDGDHRF